MRNSPCFLPLDKLVHRDDGGLRAQLEEVRPAVACRLSCQRLRSKLTPSAPDPCFSRHHKTKEASGAGEGLQLFKIAPLASFVLSLFQTVLDSFLLENPKTKEATGAKKGLQFVKTAPPASFVLSLLKMMLDGFLLGKS